MVPEVGIEPTRSEDRGILSPLRLPVSPLRLLGERSRSYRLERCEVNRRGVLVARHSSVQVVRRAGGSPGACEERRGARSSRRQRTPCGGKQRSQARENASIAAPSRRRRASSPAREGTSRARRRPLHRRARLFPPPPAGHGPLPLLLHPPRPDGFLPAHPRCSPPSSSTVPTSTGGRRPAIGRPVPDRRARRGEGGRQEEPPSSFRGHPREGHSSSSASGRGTSR